MTKKKIGLLGGTFDPPHIGHFIIADEVKHDLDLDEIWFIPTNEPPHKRAATTSNQHRFQMLMQVTNDVNYFQVNTIEFDRKGKSYTIDTVNALQTKHPDVDFYFIIGADMVEYLPKWHRIDELIELIQFVGIKRSSSSMKTTYPIHEINTPLIEVSSTEIRRRMKDNLPITFLVPSKILAYIKEHQLYE